MSFSRETIDSILDLIDPIDVVEYCGIEIKSTSQSEIRCACPIHQGDNPTAFSFDRVDKIFTCFSHNCCADKKRDVITFLTVVRQLPFHEAIKVLASIAGVNLENTQDDSNKFEKSYMRDCCDRINRINSYRNTRLKRIQIKNKFPGGWGLVDHYLRSPERNSNLEHVSAFNLYPGTDADNYLRLYIPSYDDVGRLVGLSGRAMDNILDYPPVQKSDGTVKIPPRYDNSPGFKKSYILYNLNRAKEVSQEQGLIVVEGQFDAIRMHNYGYTNTVAKLGPVLSEYQISLLYKYTNSVLLLVEDANKIDPETGTVLSIANKNKELSKFKFGMKVSVAYLEKDPDSSTKDEVDLAISNAELVKSYAKNNTSVHM